MGSEMCIRDRISALSDKVSKLESRLGSVQAECVALESEVHKMKKIIVAQQQDIEKNERILRAKNLIFNNIHEGDMSSSLSPLQNDRDKLEFIMRAAKIDVGSEDILSLQRLGKRNGEKIRPLKIVLKDTDTKYKVLNRKKAIANNYEIKKTFDSIVFVNCDNSFLVQKEEFRLRQRLKELKMKNPGASCYIRSRSLYVDDTAVDEVDITNQLF